MKPWNEYINTLPWSSRKADLATFEAHQAEAKRVHEMFKQDLFEDIGVENHPKREVLFNMAWERGHSSGYSEVYACACDLSELLDI